MNDDAEKKDGSAGRLRFSPTWLVVTTIFIDITGYGIIIPLLPFYTVSFNLGSSALGLLFATSSLMQFAAAPLLGRLSDKVGRKPILLASILLSTASFILFAIAGSFAVLVLSRILAGIASETAVAQAYMADITAESDREVGIGRIGARAAYGVGFIVGPSISGLLSVYGYAVPGFLAASVAFLNFLFVLIFLPESIPRRRDRSPSAESRISPSHWGRLREAFSQPLIGGALAIYFITTLAFAAIPVILPLLAIAYYGFTPVGISLVFIYIGIVQIVLQGFVIGRLSKTIGEERLLVLGPVLMTLGMFLIPTFPNIVAFLASMAIVSAGSGLMSTSVPSFVSKRGPADDQGEMLGVAQAVSSIAYVPGPLLGGFLFDVGGPAVPFYLGAALLAIAFGLGCRVFHACRHRAI